VKQKPTRRRDDLISGSLGKGFPKENQEGRQHRAKHQELHPRPALLGEGHAALAITLPERGMALVLGAADMIGCGKDSELVDPLPLFAFALLEFLGKLLNLPLHFLLELPEPKFLLPDFLKILLETEAIVVYWSFRFRAQWRLSRWERTDVAAAGRGSRHENGEDLLGSGQ